MTVKTILCLLLLLLIVLPLQAQPVGERVLGDVEIIEHPEIAEIRVSFNFPILYLGHFPTEGGHALRIQLQPTNMASVDRDALFHRESSTLPKLNLAGLTDLFYEGDTASGLSLVLRFQSQARWQVEQGEDYRSVHVMVLSPFPVVPGEVKSE